MRNNNQASFQVSLTPVNVSVLAASMLREKDFLDFARLLQTINGDPELLKPITPRQIGIAAKNLSEHEYGLQILIPAISSRHDLLNALSSPVIAELLSDTVESSDWQNKKEYSRGKVQSGQAQIYALLASVIAPVERLRALLKTEEMARMVQRLADDAVVGNDAESVRRSNSAFKPAQTFGLVLKVFATDSRLSQTITVEQVTTTARALYINGLLNDQSKALQDFVESLHDALQSWQVAAIEATAEAQWNCLQQGWFKGKTYLGDVLKDYPVFAGAVQKVVDERDREAKEKQRQNELARIHYDHTKVRKYPEIEKVLEQNSDLNFVPSAELVGHTIEALFKKGLHAIEQCDSSANDYYLTFDPETFDGFVPFDKFIAKLKKAPEDWKSAAADKLAELFLKGMDSRSQLFMGKAVAAMPYLMPVEKFNAVVDQMVQTHLSLTKFLHVMEGAGHLRSAYPEAVRKQVHQNIAQSGELRNDFDKEFRYFENIAVETGRGIVSGFAENGNYPALARIFERPGMPKALADEVSSRGLHITSMFKRDNSDPKIRDVMPERESISLVFRKATGDAVACLTSIEESRTGSYTCGSRPPLDVVGPVEKLNDIAVKAPVDVIAHGLRGKESRSVPSARAIVHAFTRVAADQSAPAWVQDIAKKILATGELKNG